MTQRDMTALAEHEAALEPAAAELAALGVARRAQSEEALRRARAVQALSVSSDVLYALIDSIDGLAPPIQPYARRLAGRGGAT